MVQSCAWTQSIGLERAQSSKARGMISFLLDCSCHSFSREKLSFQARTFANSGTPHLETGFGCPTLNFRHPGSLTQFFTVLCQSLIRDAAIVGRGHALLQGFDWLDDQCPGRCGLTIDVMRIRGNIGGPASSFLLQVPFSPRISHAIFQLHSLWFYRD